MYWNTLWPEVLTQEILHRGAAAAATGLSICLLISCGRTLEYSSQTHAVNPAPPPPPCCRQQQQQQEKKEEEDEKDEVKRQEESGHPGIFL